MSEVRRQRIELLKRNHLISRVLMNMVDDLEDDELYPCDVIESAIDNLLIEFNLSMDEIKCLILDIGGGIFRQGFVYTYLKRRGFIDTLNGGLSSDEEDNDCEDD